MASNWILSHTYDPRTNCLTLKTTGPPIVVREVYPRHYDAFLAAPSQGQHYHEHFAKRVRRAKR